MSDPNVRFDLRTVKRYLNSGRLEQSEYKEFLSQLGDVADNITDPEEGGDDDNFDARHGVDREAADADAPAAGAVPAAEPAPAAATAPLPPTNVPPVAVPSVVPPIAPPAAAPSDAPAPPPPPLEVPIGGSNFGPPKVD